MNAETPHSLSQVAPPIAEETAGRVTRSAGVVSLAVMGSRLLGLVREQVFAAVFGVGMHSDAFIAAFRIPNLLRDLFAEGALSAAFVSTFSQRLVTEGERAAWRLANLVFNGLLLVLTGVTLLGILLAPQIVGLIARGFEAIPGKMALTIEMTRLMFPFIILVAMAAVAMGILNSKDRFGIPASASTFFNIGSILGGVGCAYLLDPSFGPRAIIGWAIGTLIGGALQFLIQVPSLSRVGFRYEPIVDFRDEGVRQILRLMGPAIIGAAAVQVNVFVNTNFASYLGDGPVSWLNYAFRLMQFPIGVFGVAIGMATLPAVSRAAARGDLAEFRHTLTASLGLVFFLCFPSACGLIVLGEPIIRMIYEHGRFTAFDTEQTATALAFYAIGLTGYAAIKVLAPAFYALNDAHTPMRISLISIATNFTFNYLLVRQLGFGHRGLALSTSLVALFNFLALFVLMRRRIGYLEGRRLLESLGKIALASGVMALVCAMSFRELEVHFGRSGLAGHMLTALVPIGLGMITFFAACWGLRVKELDMARTALQRLRSR
ncbi:MAG: murein biosynthesis integral membrane protein MurJ [Blastocatellia bacterium]|nr:murein biosynthesis integral membrane protein MurJ [Blastocatellia bacterium]MCS7157830.1 murein biosynthesis integral membrane protein MurJ [Blastocatellia bacterium]MCX7753342.1 murein biosynthesis integral membrane protein MurJ [Blastocatellia bacterium]MDW8168093.1 murein biosynthesis integral membrane protein MurJ [Acidobacteriota bacterium]MDW8257658.1 murein biosynthesis integral membrane protein MurJ [Acidobacteriota bacterium]